MWEVHALLRAPRALFDANIFWPAPLALATHDHMLGALPLYAPLAAVSGNPVFAHQGTLLLTFALCFVAASTLVYAWTHCWTAALLAGSLFAFSPFRAEHMPWLNLQSAYYLPLLPLCAWLAASSSGVGWSILLGIVLTMQALQSYYLGYAAFVLAGALLAVTIGVDANARDRWKALVVPSLGAAAIVAISLIPYLMSSRSGTISPPDSSFLQASSVDLGTTGASSLALAFALVGIVLWRIGARHVSGAWLAGILVAGLAAHALALGPTIRVGPHVVSGPYAWLAQVVPGFFAIRVPARFNTVTTMCVATLAGVGAAGILHLLARATWTPPSMMRLVQLLILGCALWAVQQFLGGRPIPLRVAETRSTVPPVYRWLAEQPRGAVVELPFRSFQVFSFDREREALRTYRSVYHWQPIVNGYSGYAPRTSLLMHALVWHLPRPEAVARLARLGVRYVIVNEAEVTAAVRVAWEQSNLKRLRFGPQTVYELDGAVPPDRATAFAMLNDVEWHVGAFTAPSNLRARVRDPQPPRRVPAGLPVETSLVVSNESDVTWRGTVTLEAGGVALGHRIKDRDGRVVVGEGVATPLGTDIPPGETAEVPLWFSVPARPGEYVLEVFPVTVGLEGLLLDPEGMLGTPLNVHAFDLRGGPAK